MTASLKVVVQVKKLQDDAIIPNYETSGAAGFDLCAYKPEGLVLWPGQRALIPTGLSVAIPEGFEIQIRARSGHAYKKGITVLNAPGTIDADYRGELGVLLFNAGAEPFTIEHGMRIAQGVLAEVPSASFQEVDELPGTERGIGGFGHTGQ